MRAVLFAMLAGLITAAPAHARCQVGQLLEFKVTMQGPRPIADIGINGKTVPFIVDSGAFFSTISPGTAAELKLPLDASSLRMTGVGGEAGRAYIAHVKTLELAGYPIHDAQFVVAGSEFGAGGLLGQNVLGIGDVEYDLGHGAIRIMRSVGCSGSDNLAYWSGQDPVSELPIDPRNERQPHTIGTIYINGQKVRAIFDTGAGSSFLSLKAAKRAGITSSSPRVVQTAMSGGVGRSMIRTWLAPIANVAIGTEQVQNIKIRMGDVELPDADMLIGADFFLSHRVYVSNALHKMYFTYTGGPIFNATPARVIDQSGKDEKIAADSASNPTDAAGFSRRGAAELSRRDFTAALADLDRAVTMEPTNGRYLLELALAQAQVGNRAAAFADLDRAVKAAPEDREIRLAHAEALFTRERRAEARNDLDSLDATLPPEANERLTMAALFERLDQFDKAIANYDSWIKAHPDDSRQPLALNGRCWARALAGRDLPLALKDCDGALRRMKSANTLDSRGLVELRMGEYDRAIADYDEALKLAPQTAWSLYGRGLARRHKNDPAAKSDIEAAVAIEPKLPDRAQALGIN